MKRINVPQEAISQFTDTILYVMLQEKGEIAEILDKMFEMIGNGAQDAVIDLFDNEIDMATSVKLLAIGCFLKQKGKNLIICNVTGKMMIAFDKLGALGIAKFSDNPDAQLSALKDMRNKG